MKKLSLTTLVAAVVFGAMGSPGYVAASDCCPGGGGVAAPPASPYGPTAFRGPI